MQEFHRGSPAQWRRIAFAAVIGVIGVIGMPAVVGPAAAADKDATLVIDANSGKVLAASNADALRYPASLTKMMTLYLLFETLKAGKLALDSKLVASARAETVQPSKLGLKQGDTITVENAIKALVTKSANDVAITVAENLAGSEAKFARVMTARAREIGMTNTTFRNASGLPDTEQQTTARDMSVLALRLYDDFPEYWHYFATTSFTYAGKTYRSHNGLLFGFAGTDGIKTGYTRASGFNLVSSVRRDRKHLIGVVMGGSSASARNATMRRLLTAALQKASTRKTRVPARSPALVLAEAPKPAKRPALTYSESVSSGLTNADAGTWETNVVPQPTEVVRAGTGSAEGDADAAVLMAFANSSLAKAAARTEVAAVEDAGYHVQIGAFGSEAEANSRLALVQSRAPALVGGFRAITLVFTKGEKTFYRARFTGFDQNQAHSTCAGLKQQNIDCLVMRAQ
jgi:D-alanyl-D-alanine carboxypeptidase